MSPVGLLRRRSQPPTTERVHLLMFNATGHGGVARSVTGLANELAATHEVHIHSLLRNSDEPQYPIDPRVQVHWLIENRDELGGRPRRNEKASHRRRALDREPSALEPDPAISAYTDQVLRRALPGLSPGVLITTRPMLHAAATRWAPEHVLLVAQDHGNFERRMRNPHVTRLLDEAVPKVDAFVALTEADRVDYQQRYPGTPIARIPNASPFHRGTRSSLDAKVVISAGRLVGEKGFDRLVEAWAPLAKEFPDWRLHIYGEGERGKPLQRQIDALGIGGSAVLKGYTREFDKVLGGAGLYAMSSRTEGFPMVLLEAMSHGLPLVSFDCPRGPAEIIRDGENGRLVPDHDIAGYTQALREVLGDDEGRRRMGAAAYDDAQAYEVETVVAAWEQLLTETLARRLAT